MEKVFGLLDSQKKGDEALVALERAGIPVDKIEVMNKNDPDPHAPIIGSTVRTTGKRVENLDSGKTHEELLLKKGVAEHEVDDFVGVIQHGGSVIVVETDDVAKVRQVLADHGAEVRPLERH